MKGKKIFLLSLCISCFESPADNQVKMDFYKEFQKKYAQFPAKIKMPYDREKFSPIFKKHKKTFSLDDVKDLIKRIYGDYPEQKEQLVYIFLDQLIGEKIIRYDDIEDVLIEIFENLKNSSLYKYLDNIKQIYIGDDTFIRLWKLFDSEDESVLPDKEKIEVVKNEAPKTDEATTNYQTLIERIKISNKLDWGSIIGSLGGRLNIDQIEKILNNLERDEKHKRCDC